jgi:hypothetical protein
VIQQQLVGFLSKRKDEGKRYLWVVFFCWQKGKAANLGCKYGKRKYKKAN